MHFTRFWSIVEHHHDIQNPSSPHKLDYLIDLLALQPTQHILDIGSGRGWLLSRIATRTGASGTGIEINPWFCQVAHQRAKSHNVEHLLTIIESDAKHVSFDSHSFDAVLCIGATFALGGLDATLSYARKVAKPNAPIIIGDIFRYHDLPPTMAEYGIVPTLGELVDCVRGDAEPYELLVSTHEEWDRYETKKWQTAREWMLHNAEDPEYDELVSRVAKMRHDYLHLERDTIGWAMIMTYNT